MERGALFDDSGSYRFELWRRWSEGPELAWVLLNPSTADDRREDPTVRRCIGFSSALGFGGLRLVNLFAFRSTDPRALVLHPDPDPVANLEHVRAVLSGRELVVVGWGAISTPLASRSRTLSMLQVEGASAPAHRCLGTTKDGSPRHPLYLKADATLRPWPGGSLRVPPRKGESAHTRLGTQVSPR